MHAISITFLDLSLNYSRDGDSTCPRSSLSPVIAAQAQIYPCIRACKTHSIGVSLSKLARLDTLVASHCNNPYNLIFRGARVTRATQITQITLKILITKSSQVTVIDGSTFLSEAKSIESLRERGT
jgi:hypothetical protein